jgi:hypothetical protein
LTILAKSSVRVSIHINKRHASSGHLITNDDEMMRYLNYEPSIDRGIW